MEAAAEMVRGRPAPAPRKRAKARSGTSKSAFTPRNCATAVKGKVEYGRSKLSNAIGRLQSVDGRSLIGRRFRDIVIALVKDAGGAAPSEAKMQLIRRFAACAVLAEQREAALANGADINIAEHAQLCSALVRLASRIGIDRVPRDVTPTLSEYIDQRYGNGADSDNFEDAE